MKRRPRRRSRPPLHPPPLTNRPPYQNCTIRCVTATSQNRTEHVDVLIVGAGISGLGVAHYLVTNQPGKTLRDRRRPRRIGGTWDLFRYPGIRSDSDLHTFGYEFKPWTRRDAIADAPRDPRLPARDRRRGRHRPPDPLPAQGARAACRLRGRRVDGQRSTPVSGYDDRDWLFGATGYYHYDEGSRRTSRAREHFDGEIVHPQYWPEDLDYNGKKVVVIGSGATAVTLIPAMADDVEHITMLQRSPSYVMPLPRKDPIANALRKLLGKERAMRRRAASTSRSSDRSTTCASAIRKLRGASSARSTSSSCPRAITSTRTSIRPTTRGINACARCPTPTCSGDPRRARPRWSPTASSRSPSGESCWSPAASSRPTSSSPQPV